MYSIFWWGWVVKTEHMKLSQLSSSSENPMKSRWYTRVDEASNFESNGCINLDYASDDHSLQWVPDVLTSQKSLYGIMFSQPFGTCSPLISNMGIRTTKEFGLSYFVCEKVSLKKEFRLRAVSYFSLQSYCTRNPSMRAVKPRGAINEGWRRVCLLRKSPQSVFSRLVPIVVCNRAGWDKKADFMRKRGLQAV